MFCPYCEEIVTADERARNMAVPVNGGLGFMHRECLVRSVAGSVTHIRGECTRQGGEKDCHECEEGLTVREAARASYREVIRRQAARN